MQIENTIFKMQSLIRRQVEDFFLQNLTIFPALALLGPRQCGKSTLVKMLSPKLGPFLYLDLQNPVDFNKLFDPVFFFETNQDYTICIDEVQQFPGLFSILRSVIDKSRKPGRYILLGSASRELIRQSSESLAGRIGIIELAPFNFFEIRNQNSYALEKFWLRGGYPDSYLSTNDENSSIWRENFIRTYIERDIPQLGLSIPALQIRRLLTMCAHNQGQLLNASKLAESMGLTHPTIRRYIDLLEQTFIIRTLQPFEANIKKRLIKSPKVFIRDSGILNKLLLIDTFNDLLGNPVFGSSWEGLVIENILTSLRNWQPFFYRTATGDELDLILTKGNRIIAVECKASSAPKLTKGFWKAIEDIKPDKTYIITPAEDYYLIKENIIICGLKHFQMNFPD